MESFRNSQRITVVGTRRSVSRPQFVIRIFLREFQAEEIETNQPRVRIGLDVVLEQMPGRHVIGTMSITKVARAESRRIEAVVDAFDAALGKVLKALVEWTLDKGRRAPRPIRGRQRQRSAPGRSKSSRG